MVPDIEQVGLLLKHRKYLIKENKITKLSLTFPLMAKSLNRSYVNQILMFRQTATLERFQARKHAPLRASANMIVESSRKHVELRFAFADGRTSSNRFNRFHIYTHKWILVLLLFHPLRTKTFAFSFALPFSWTHSGAIVMKLIWFEIEVKSTSTLSKNSTMCLGILRSSQSKIFEAWSFAVSSFKGSSLTFQTIITDQNSFDAIFTPRFDQLCKSEGLNNWNFLFWNTTFPSYATKGDKVRFCRCTTYRHIKFET